MRHSPANKSILVIMAILAGFALALPASAQTVIPDDFCPVGTCDNGQGDSIGGNTDVEVDGAGGPPGVPGADGANSANGQDAGGQAGTSTAGQPGQSGRPTPPAPPPPPRRSTSTSSRSSTANRSATAVSTPSPEPSPSPTESPSPTPSPTESPTPTPTPSDLVAALETDPTASDGSLVPFLLLLGGALLLFLYVKSRRPARRRGMHSTGRRSGSHSF